MWTRGHEVTIVLGILIRHELATVGMSCFLTEKSSFTKIPQELTKVYSMWHQG